MGLTGRRFYAVLGTACARVAGVVAVVLVLAFSSTSEAAPTKAQYLARVASVCRVYSPKLDAVPVADVAEPGNVIEDVNRALPLIKAELAAVRRIPPPRELKPRVDRWFAIHDQGVAYLEQALAAGHRVDLRSLIVAYGHFIVQGPKARQLGAAIGIPASC